jgi:hypothetical protein
MYQGIFIDTQTTDKPLADLMSIAGRSGLKVKFQTPIEFTNQVEQILDLKPDLLALDYHLNETGKKRSYTAGALAQQLRDSILESHTPDFPIVLVSNEENLKVFFDNLTAHSLFDRCFTKQALSNGSDSNQQIFSLVKGYKHLIKNWHQSERWSRFLGLKKSERIRVGYQGLRELDKLKVPHQVVRDILRYVIDRQGLLLDQYNVLAELGVAPTSKNITELLGILQKDKVLYTGGFSEGWTRWWRHRLENWSDQLCEDVLGNLTAKERVSCLNKKFGLKLSPAKSRWENHTDALVWIACDSCHQPTELQHSVAAYDPLPYSFAHGKRVCWKCVETGEFEKQGLEIDEDEEFIVEKIQNGEIR